MAVTYEVLQNLANLWINVAFFKIQNNTGNRKFVGQERKKRKKKKREMTPTVTLQEILVFHQESSLKGLLGPWRSCLTQQCHCYGSLCSWMCGWMYISVHVRGHVCLFVLFCVCPWFLNSLIISSSQQNKKMLFFREVKTNVQHEIVLWFAEPSLCAI